MKAHWEKFRQHGECCMVELDYCYIVCARSPVANEYDTTDKPPGGGGMVVFWNGPLQPFRGISFMTSSVCLFWYHRNNK